MRTYTKTVREGGNMGPIDWSYDFRQYFNNYCCDDKRKDEMCESRKAFLKQAENAFRAGKSVSVTIGEWTNDLLDVGMYGGWPFWKPVPAVYVRGPLGGEWQFFYEIDGVSVKD